MKIKHVMLDVEGELSDPVGAGKLLPLGGGPEEA
jgi:hypothetical protein